MLNSSDNFIDKSDVVFVANLSFFNLWFSSFNEKTPYSIIINGIF